MSPDRVGSSVLYICGRYPELSQTFVTAEIDMVGSFGWHPIVYSLFEPSSDAPQNADIDHRRLSDRQLPSMRSLLTKATYRFPIGTARVLRYLRTSPKGQRRQRLREALTIALERRGAELDRVHAHFASHPATVAMLVGWLLDIPFSFTAHARDIFAQDIDVAAKMQAADVCVTVCNYNADFMVQRWGEPARMAIVPCGVSAHHFTRSTPYMSHPFHLVSVARLVEKKGLDLLVEACRLLRECGIDFRTTIVGEGPERERLATAINRGGLDDVITLAGAVPHSELKDLLEGATAFCLPCRVSGDGDRDSQPVVIKEAMAMEIPVVATNVFGIPEVVDGTCGVLVAPDDPAALASAICHLVESSHEDLAELGRSGRRRIMDEFAFERTIPRLIDEWGGGHPPDRSA